MKKFILGFIVGAAIMIPVTALGQTAIENIQAYLNPNVKISIDGEPLVLDNTPIVYEQTTYLPLREIGEKIMGMTVGWNQDTSTVELITTDAWPISDVTDESKMIEGEIVKTKDDVDFGMGYTELFTNQPNEIKTSEEINNQINQIKSWLSYFKKGVQEPDKHPEHVIDRFNEEIPRLESLLSEWETVKSHKEAEQTQQEEPVTE